MARQSRSIKLAKGTEGFVQRTRTIRKGPKGKKVDVVSGSVWTIEPNGAGLTALAKLWGGMEAVGSFVATSLENANTSRLGGPFLADGSIRKRKDGTPVVADVKAHAKHIAETCYVPTLSSEEKRVQKAVLAKVKSMSPEALAKLMSQIGA